jgi:hypothetical protein
MTGARQRAIVLALALSGAITVAAGCGGGPKQTTRSNWAGFECKNRRAEYMVTGGFAGPEAGISVTCDATAGPRIVKYLVDADNRRRESAHGLGPGEFNALWERLNSTGWHNLGDCENEDASDTDPVYSFDLSDDWTSKSMSCTGRELPFPWDAIVSELDQKAAEYGD